jgi:hypothetical protein
MAKPTITLARLSRQDSAKKLASELAGKGSKKTWTKKFAASGAKPGGKGTGVA